MKIDPKLSLILASKSPRRSYLLEQAGIPFTVRTADTEEIYPQETPVMEVAPYLAELKASGAAHLLLAENEAVSYQHLTLPTTYTRNATEDDST